MSLGARLLSRLVARGLLVKCATGQTQQRAGAAAGRRLSALPQRQLSAAARGADVGLQQLLEPRHGRPARQLCQARSVSGSSASSGAGDQGKVLPKRKPIPERIGIIGAGMMGEALLRGFFNASISSPGRISCSVNTLERRQALEGMGVGNIFDDAEAGGARDVAKSSDIVIIAVKPQCMDGVLKALAPHVTSRHLVISIAAGIRLATMEEALGEGVRVVRVMPNTPCLVQCGASAYALGQHATAHDADLVHDLLSSIGLALAVDEKMMDAVTGLSGSGPAYVFLMIEALADGGVAAGLSRDTALALAAKTVAGAASMVMQGSSAGTVELTHPGVLKDRVASPAGTTIAGLMELESSGFRGAVMRAVKAAAKRSEELG